MGIRQSGARNAGTARLLEQRIRQDTDGEAQPIAYDNAGVTHDAPGDDEGLFVKEMPFPTLEQGWAEFAFSNGDPQPENTVPVGEYAFLPPLFVDGVRRVLVWIEFEGRADQTSVFSLIPGVFLQGGGDGVPEFFPLSHVPEVVTDVTLSPPFDNQAKSREIMPAEFRTEIITGATAAARTIRFVKEFEVSPYTKFGLVVAELSQEVAVQTSTARFRYSYSM